MGMSRLIDQLGTMTASREVVCVSYHEVGVIDPHQVVPSCYVSRTLGR